MPSDPLFTPIDSDNKEGVTKGAGMLKRMQARNGPARGTKEYFATLQKQGRIKNHTKGYGKKKIFGS